MSVRPDANIIIWQLKIEAIILGYYHTSVRSSLTKLYSREETVKDIENLTLIWLFPINVKPERICGTYQEIHICLGRRNKRKCRGEIMNVDLKLIEKNWSKNIVIGSNKTCTGKRETKAFIF